MNRAKEARRQRNQQELDRIREFFIVALDGLQQQIEDDTLDNLALETFHFTRDVTTDDSEWVQWESSQCKSATLHIVTRFGKP